MTSNPLLFLQATARSRGGGSCLVPAGTRSAKTKESERKRKEDSGIRKKTSALLVSAVILSVLLIPTVLASKPIPVSGTWSWKAPSTYMYVEKEANGNIFIHADDDALFTGTFEGTGYDEFTMTEHPNGFYTGSGRTEFTGIVEDKSGSLSIMWVGNTKHGEWRFKWVIISGTGELENLRGQGTCSGLGPTGPGVWGSVAMTGTIHFDPS